jgi:hypothetical protein
MKKAPRQRGAFFVLDIHGHSAQGKAASAYLHPANRSISCMRSQRMLGITEGVERGSQIR